MRVYILALVTGLLIACGDNVTDPPAQDPNPLRVINGPVTCNACSSVELSVAGPDLDGVTDATLALHSSQAVVGTTAEVRNFVGDSGLVLHIKVTFTDSVPAGSYDLHLLKFGGPGSGATLSIPAAVKVTAPFGGPTRPPPPPGPIGRVRVAAPTTGPQPPGQYLAKVTPCDPVYVCPGRPVSPGGSVSIELNPGNYTISLADVPTSCTVAQPTAVAVTLAANQTVDVSFSVTCVTPATGVLRISAPTTGASFSPYVATVSPCDLIHPCSTFVSANSAASMVLNTGSYTLTLGNLESGCTVAPPQSIQVTIGQGQTVNASFAVACPPAGTVHVTASVTGPDQDHSFVVTEGDCDYYYYCNSKNLVAGASVDFTLSPGSHTITLGGLASNCTVAGPNPRPVTVVPDQRTDVVFAITCVATARIRVSVTTTGVDPDQGYQASIGSCTATQCTLWLDANGFVEFTPIPGTYTVELFDVASNCTVSGTHPVTVNAAAGVTTSVAFAVTCTALPPPPPSGVVRVTAPTTGTNRDASFFVVNESSCDFYYGCTQQPLPATGAVEFTAVVGPTVFRLTDVAANCTVGVANPVTVTVVANTTTELAFPVACH